jgi:pimeloyl-ACP methyl ester carboxylesterase
VDVDEHTIELDGEPVFYRRAPADGAVPLYLHSIPTSADDWTSVLRATGGVAVDLPGFGRSGKGGQLDYSVTGYVNFLERFLDVLDAPRFVLVGHGWGGAFALLLAGRQPERVAGLALLNAVPLLDGFVWPRPVRWCRTMGIGELVMGSINRRLLARLLRAGSVSPSAWPDEEVERVWTQFDQGTQRAILRLLRSVDVEGLARAGRDLARLHQPALVLWGDQDPWLAPEFGDGYAAQLPNARLEHVAAGHWPWLDRPELLDSLSAFVSAP